MGWWHATLGSTFRRLLLRCGRHFESSLWQEPSSRNERAETLAGHPDQPLSVEGSGLRAEARRITEGQGFDVIIPSSREEMRLMQDLENKTSGFSAAEARSVAPASPHFQFLRGRIPLPLMRALRLV